RESGVGATFAMGSGRETKYFYGKPAQEHLDRLFGNDAGNSSHYQKNMVVDPNGQVSISYIDAHGRTVATALAGADPTNTEALEAADYLGEEAQLITYDLLNNVSGSLISTYSLMVSEQGDYNFDYVAGGANYDPECGLADVSCYGCVYDVKIVITDNDCNAFNDGEPYVIEDANYTLFDDYGLSCSSIGLDKDFVLSLPIGSYEITKTLTLSQGAVDFYETHYRAYIEGLEYDAGANQPDCIPFYEELLAGYPIPTDCSPNTADCLADLGSEADYLTSFALDIGLSSSSLLSAEQQALARAEYSELVEACNALEGPSTCDVYAEILKSDLRPTELPDPLPLTEDGCMVGGLNGQYALYQIVDGAVEAANQASIFYSPDGSTYPYQSIDFGSISVVIDGVSYSPSALSPTDFVTYFHDSWLPAMISTHPEYCYYTACLNEGPGDFDLALRQTNSYSDALTFLGVSQQPLPPFDIDFVLAADPFFAGSLSCQADMETLLNNFDASSDAPGLVDWISRTIYSYGIGGCTTYFGQGTAGENNRAWQLFRGIYLGYKEQIRLEKLTTDGCSLTLPTCVGEGNCPCPIIRRFPDPNTDYSITLEEALELATSTEQEMVNILSESGCAGMRGVWRLELLSNCDGYLDLDGIALQQFTDDIDDILDALQAVCELGTDAAHPLGASGTYFKPDGTRALTSGEHSTFADVLESMQPTGLSCETWHPFMISAPGPYERSAYYGATAVVSKANTCACEQLKKLEACYENDNEDYASFGEYLTRYGGHQLSAQELQLLQAACDDGPMGEPSRYLPQPMQLPQYLTCEGCLGCDEMQELFDAASNAYDAQNFPSGAVDFNDFLAEYANYQLGYAFDSGVYTNFYKGCGQRELTCSDAILLCPETPFDADYDLEDLPDCIETAIIHAQQQAQLQYEAQLEALMADFVNSYIEYCTNPVNVAEQFTTSGLVHEYHHTLYYYDQAGNLAKTVPPKGIVPATDLSGVAAFRAGISTTAVYPVHEMITHYQYNSLQELIAKQMPDCEPEYYWYDEIGRLVLSQDGRQRADGEIYYSYTLYDELGRVHEVGEINVNAAFITGLDADGDHKVLYCDFTDAIAANADDRRYITSTYYDAAAFSIAAFGPNGQENLRPRVSSVTFLESTVGGQAYDYATHYSYDVTGNVKTLIQELRPLAGTGHDFKRIDYDYDFLSGNVNAVYYQRGQADQFTYRYLYDEHNRLTDVYTSAVNINEPFDDSFWEREVVYEYYPHGPLARTQHGQRNVQGCDYAYTLQGWIKGVNSSALEADRDMGRDGTTSSLPGSTSPSPNAWVARDAFAYTLGYFENDYQALGGEDARFEAQVAGTAFNTGNESLYNGNVRHMVSQSRGLAGGASGNRYQYDQLHRILEMRTYELQTDATAYTWGSNLTDRGYASSYTYDPNGNLKTLQRKDDNGQIFDNLIYHYGNFSVSEPITSSNELRTVRDLVGGNEGVQGQSISNGNNYDYDDSGNLTEDIQAGAALVWNPYGKVEQIDFTNSEDNLPNRITLFDYGPDQNRVRKTYLDIAENEVRNTFYIRDAQGNCLAVYEQDINGEVSWQEQHIYGSKRLGLWRPAVALDLGAIPNTPYFADEPLSIGQKTYELSNHLGNVTATISDRVTPVDDGTGMVDHYLPVVRSANEYYPFGMDMAGRSLNFDDYRFGFNGKEADTENEWGAQTHYDYGFRIYNPGIARFLSVDPLAPEYPELTPYQFASLTPIWAIDLDGLEADYTNGTYRVQSGQTFHGIEDELGYERGTLESLNQQLEDINHIEVGQTLNIANREGNLLIYPNEANFEQTVLLDQSYLNSGNLPGETDLGPEQRGEMMYAWLVGINTGGLVYVDAYYKAQLAYIPFLLRNGIRFLSRNSKILLRDGLSSSSFENLFSTLRRLGPQSRPIPLEGELSISQARRLMEIFPDNELALIKETSSSGHVNYQLYFGTTNRLRFQIPKNTDVKLIFHTHPSGNPIPSKADIRALELLNQNESIIIPRGHPEIIFNQASKTLN
ncbi:MAG: RHS repeat-associated core domain-containing protein, partial [Bacteroidota bacterium]